LGLDDWLPGFTVVEFCEFEALELEPAVEEEELEFEDPEPDELLGPEDGLLGIGLYFIVYFIIST
jgi:hypothetical protein